LLLVCHNAAAASVPRLDASRPVRGSEARQCVLMRSEAPFGRRFNCIYKALEFIDVFPSLSKYGSRFQLLQCNLQNTLSQDGMFRGMKTHCKSLF
jgi:hypothetical protein